MGRGTVFCFFFKIGFKVEILCCCVTMQKVFVLYVDAHRHHLWQNTDPWWSNKKQQVADLKLNKFSNLLNSMGTNL